MQFIQWFFYFFLCTFIAETALAAYRHECSAESGQTKLVFTDHGKRGTPSIELTLQAQTWNFDNDSGLQMTNNGDLPFAIIEMKQTEGDQSLWAQFTAATITGVQEYGYNSRFDYKISSGNVTTEKMSCKVSTIFTKH